MIKINPSVDLSATALARFWSKVEKSADCWLWTGRISTNGYGKFKADREYSAHRVSYEATTGAIPEGLVIDHLCRVRACVNPDHLEPVTQRENVLRGEGACASHAAKTHCDKGHALIEGNLAKSKPNTRVCKTCHRDYHRDNMRKIRAAKKAA